MKAWRLLWQARDEAATVATLLPDPLWPSQPNQRYQAPADFPANADPLGLSLSHIPGILYLSFQQNLQILEPLTAFYWLILPLADYFLQEIFAWATALSENVFILPHHIAGDLEL